MSLTLTYSERAEIKRTHKSCAERRFADRLKALLLLDDGLSCVRVGEVLLLDDDTVRNYREIYKGQGLKGLISDGNKGTAHLLEKAALDELNKHLQTHTYPDSKGIIAWVKNKYKITYTTSGITCLLKRMGFVYKKPVLTPCKANIEAQRIFVKEYKTLKEGLQESDRIYFMDGVHPQHNSVGGFGWIKRGHKKQLKTNNGRKRTNINGALDVSNGELFYVEDEQINSQTMISLLQIILKAQKEGKIYIVLDNARYYHSNVVKEFIKENPRICLKFLPPYSPNLNIIERLWGIMKKKVIHNRFYLKFDDFKLAVNDFFKTMVWKQKEFENILNDNFQLIKPDFSGSYM